MRRANEWVVRGGFPPLDCQQEGAIAIETYSEGGRTVRYRKLATSD